jgi:hypothetical protein
MLRLAGIAESSYGLVCSLGAGWTAFVPSRVVSGAHFLGSAAIWTHSFVTAQGG